MGDRPAGGSVAEGVGLTALMVAAARAVENNRLDPLFRDPLAECFVRAVVPPIRFPSPIGDVPRGNEEDVWGRAGRYLALRTRVFDDFIQGAVDDGVCQVVMLCAGLDTRAFRLSWRPGCAVYELDRPAVHGFKRQVLTDVGATACVRHTYVSADREEDWPARLRAAGFDPALPTVWTAEGVLPFLSDDAELGLVSVVVGSSAPGSRIGFDTIVAEPGADPRGADPADPAGPGEPAGVALDDLPGRRTTRPDSARMLHDSGWRLSVRTPFDFTPAYGRGSQPGPKDSAAHARLITGVCT